MEPEKLALVERDTHLVRLIEAIHEIQSTSAWSTLKEEFDEEMARLNRLLIAEAKKAVIDAPEIYRLQGRIESARKHSLENLFTSAMNEHNTIKRKLN